MITPGEIYLKEAQKEMEEDYSDLPQEDRQFIEQVYEQAGGTSIWITAEFPYVWNFKLAYPLVALFLCGLFTLIRGFGIAKLQWKWVFIAVTVPYSILFLTLALELLRGCQPLKGMWLGIIGGALIVFGTFMTKPKPEPVGSGQPM
jgi:hypothetical protein